MKTDSVSVIKKLLLIFLVVSGIYYAKSFLMPLAIGGVIAMLFLPFCNWLERKKIPKGIAVFICLLSVMAVMAGIVGVLGWQISKLIGDFTLIKQKIIEDGILAQQYIFDNLGIAVSKQSEILKSEQPSVATVMQMLLGPLSSVFTSLILVLAYIFLLLFYRVHLRVFILKLTPPSQIEEMNQIVLSTTRVAQQYLVGLAKMIVCLWIMYGIGFGILGVENFIFFAVLCGLLEIVPFIGNITGTTLTVLVTAFHGGSLAMIGGVVVTYGVVQFIQGWVLEPVILGPQVKVNPLFTVIALVLGELVWGIPGMILAIPLTAIFKIICDHIESLKPFGFLIGEIEVKKRRSSFLETIKIPVKRK